MTIKSTSNCQHHHNVHRDMYYDFIVYEAKITQSISQTTSNKVRLKSTYIWKSILYTKHSRKNAAEFFLLIMSYKFWRNFVIKKLVVWIINSILYNYQMNWLIVLHMGSPQRKFVKGKHRFIQKKDKTYQ